MAKRAKSFKQWCVDKKKDCLLLEWSEKNGIYDHTSDNTEYNTPLKRMWRCEQGHEWECSVIERTVFGLRCPECYPEDKTLPVGTKYGCLKIISINNLDKPSYPFNYSYEFVCQCKCGLIHVLDPFHFIEKRHKYCTEALNEIALLLLNDKEREECQANECDLRRLDKEKLTATYKRIRVPSYDIDYTGKVFESLEIKECINDNYEKLAYYRDRRKKGGGIYNVYKLYKCQCYLCEREQEVECDRFEINPPTEYGSTAYNGFWSKVSCNCHKVSSFQWIVNKILFENDINYRVEVSFSDLLGVSEKHPLSFDFAIYNSDGSIKLLIECQGEQHFRPVEKFGGKRQFEIQKNNDERKREYVRINNIPLLEISYKQKTYDEIKKILEENNVL